MSEPVVRNTLRVQRAINVAAGLVLLGFGRAAIGSVLV